MFTRKTQAATRLAIIKSRPSTVNYTAPEWVAEWPAELGEDIVADLLVLHERLLTSAASSAQTQPFLDAAVVVRQLTRQHTSWPRVHDNDSADVRPETNKSVAALLRVLRDWDGNLFEIHSALRLASDWASHADLITTAAETKKSQAKAKPTTFLENTYGVFDKTS